MAITRIDDPPFIVQSEAGAWSKIDAGKRSYGLYKAYNTDSITAAQLGLKTIRGALVTKMTVDKNLHVQGSVQVRGSNANNLVLFLASGGTDYGTFAHVYVDAWGH